MPRSSVVGTFEIEIRGRKLPIEVDTEGRFSSIISEKRFSSEKLEDLRAQLMVHTKKITAKVSVPATYITAGGSYGSATVAKAVTLTGIHAKDGDILFRYDGDGKADRATPHQNFLTPMTDAERATYNLLSKAKYDAHKAVEEFMTAHKINALKTVEEAIAAATDPAV